MKTFLTCILALCIFPLIGTTEAKAGVDPTEPDISISIYVKDQKIYVELLVLPEKTAMVEIYNMMGQKIGSREAAQGEIVISEPLSAGVYIVKVISGEYAVSKRVTVPDIHYAK